MCQGQMQLESCQDLMDAFELTKTQVRFGWSNDFEKKQRTVETPNQLLPVCLFISPRRKLWKIYMALVVDVHEFVPCLCVIVHCA